MQLGNKHPSIDTTRLVLAPYQMSDVDELHRVMSDPRVMQHVGKGVLDRSEVEAIVSRTVARWNDTGMGWWTIRLRDTRYLIGQICLRPEPDLPEIAVGYALDAVYWRRGYAKEALRAVVDYGFNKRALRRIVATVRAENTPSRALLTDCGFVREPDLHIRNKILCLYACTSP